MNPQPTGKSEPEINPEHITYELYKKNLELTERNKTLSLLRKIDEIILSSVTDIEQVARQIANTVIIEAGLKGIFIFVAHKKEQLLTPFAVSISKEINQIDINLQRAIYNVKLSLKEKDNLVIKSIKEKKNYTANDLFTLLQSRISQDACFNIQKTVGIHSFIISPLIIRAEAIGSLVFCLAEEEKALSIYKNDLIERLPSVIGVAIDNALLYQKIQETNVKLKELDKLKDEFVSIASHELRTPMTAIKSYLWMALNKPKVRIDPELKSQLEIAFQETERLIKLVQNLLTISRIESKRMEMDIEPVDMNNLAKHVFDELQIKADEKKLTYELKLSSDKLIVNGDKDKLEEVLENILGNALKYTSSSDKVSLSLNKEKDKIVITISDTGPGISKENLPKIFLKFSRIEQTKSERTPGTGLGLFITKQIVDLHKGSIKVNSEVGKGTNFIVYLPSA